MTILPKLFTKHQADSERMEGLLAIPALMKLSLYLDLRKNAVSGCNIGNRAELTTGIRGALG